MNVHTPPLRSGPNSAAIAALEFKVQATNNFQQFEHQLDAALAELEYRLREFVTHRSFAKSLGR